MQHVALAAYRDQEIKEYTCQNGGLSTKQLIGVMTRPLVGAPFVLLWVSLALGLRTGQAEPRTLLNITLGPRHDAWIETMSWKPRAYVYHGFLSNEECDHIINLATPRIARSSVINFDGSTNPADDIRTSYGTFLEPAHDPVILDIEQRVAQWSHLPASHAESMQVLRYEFNQKYGAHWDELDPTNDERSVGRHGSSPRVGTVLLYLSDVEEGGETAFPHSIWIDKEIQTAGNSYSDCTNGGVAVKPKKGDALLFWGLKVDLKHLEPFSMHAGCPVLKGIKWSATKWLHTKPFITTGVYDQPVENNAGNGLRIDADPHTTGLATLPLAGACQDEDERCGSWAAKGECEKNPKYMLGTDISRGKCLKSCGMCCQPGDVLCERRVAGQLQRSGSSI